MDARKTASKKSIKVKKGGRYSCNMCGLVVTVDTICGCVDTCEDSLLW